MTSPPGKQVVEIYGLADLQFDPENPRLPVTVDGHNEQQVLQWMLGDDSLTELIGSIGEQDYFPGEPVLVAPPDAGGHGPPFLVVEGNRRLAAVKLLADPQLAPIRSRAVESLVADARSRPTALPAIVFGSRDEILDYLGYRHVTGVKEWGPLAKARYLEQLVRRAKGLGDPLTYQRLARRIGSRPDYVQRLLGGLNVYDHAAENGFYRLEGVNEDAISFSVLTTALSYQKIAAFVGTDEVTEIGGKFAHLSDESLRDLLDWMFRKRGDGATVLGESRNLGELAAVVSVPVAVKALRDGLSLGDALLLTNEPLEAFRRAVRQAADKLNLARTMTHRIASPTDADLSALTDLTNIARELAIVVSSKIENIDPTV